MGRAFTMELSKRNESRRPTLVIEVDRDPLNNGCHISLTVQKAMGQPTIYIEFTPEEADVLGTCLLGLVEPARALDEALNAVPVEE